MSLGDPGGDLHRDQRVVPWSPLIALKLVPDQAAGDNPLGGAPDPFVCVTLTGDTKPRCSTAPSDTYKPAWSTSGGTATAGTLAAGMDVAMYDDDGSAVSPDLIGLPGKIGLTVDHFKKGVIDVEWKGYASARITIAPK